MDLSLGTPGLISKLPPSVKDVKDLCFGTFPSANLPLKYSPVGSYEKQQQPIRYVYPEEENTSEDEDDKDEGGKANFPFSIFMRLPYV
ncbi:hypothetical protein MKW94_019406, partial [Papaver nudicaule]|nr:hypothetical protein [Papaver nudicaule]